MVAQTYDPEDIMDAETLANRIGLKVITVERKARRREIPSFGIAKRRLFSFTDVLLSCRVNVLDS